MLEYRRYRSGEPDFLKRPNCRFTAAFQVGAPIGHGKRKELRRLRIPANKGILFPCFRPVTGALLVPPRAVNDLRPLTRRKPLKAPSESLMKHSERCDEYQPVRRIVVMKGVPISCSAI